VTYKRIVRGKIIELEDKVALPEGSLVEVSIKEGPGEGLAPTSHPKGSSPAMLAALDAAPRCTTEMWRPYCGRSTWGIAPYVLRVFLTKRLGYGDLPTDTTRWQNVALAVLFFAATQEPGSDRGGTLTGRFALSGHPARGCYWWRVRPI
jgi:hypothetical protein